MRSLYLCAILACGWAALGYATTAGATPPDNTTRAQFAERLIAAAFKEERPSGYDVTMYRTAVGQTQSEKAIRNAVKKMYDKTEAGAAFKQGTPEGDAEQEAEVQRILKEQRERNPKRFFIRVRISGDRFRIDKTTLKTDMSFRPDLAFDETTIIADGLFIKYDNSVFIDPDHEQHGDVNRLSAYVAPSTAKGTSSSQISHNKKELDGWFVVPEQVRNIGLMLFAGRGPDQDRKKLVKDPDKVKAFLEGDSSPFFSTVNITTMNDAGQNMKDLVELTVAAGTTRTVMIVDHSDYSKLHEYSVYREPGDRLMSRIEYQYDEGGNPKKINSVEYDLDKADKLYRRWEVTIVQSTLNPSLPAEIFQWREPPNGYLVTDKRGPEVKFYRVGGPPVKVSRENE